MASQTEIISVVVIRRRYFIPTDTQGITSYYFDLHFVLHFLEKEIVFRCAGPSCLLPVEFVPHTEMVWLVRSHARIMYSMHRGAY